MITHYDLAEDVLSCPNLMSEYQRDRTIMDRLNFPTWTNEAIVRVQRNSYSKSSESPLEYQFQFLDVAGNPVGDPWVYTSRIFRGIRFHKTWDGADTSSVEDFLTEN